MRTNHAGITEKAEFKIDQDKFNEGWERVFGKKKCTCKVDVTEYGEGIFYTCDYCEERVLNE
jgi:hypothetical protein